MGLICSCSSAVAIIGFTAASFYPIFAVSKGVKLEKFFRKARMFTFLISIAGGIATLLLARIAVILAYGREYLPATVILKLFSVLAILIPVSGIYDSYFLSQKKTKVIAITVFVTTVINVVLNLTGIKIGLSNPGFFLQESGAMGAIVGVSIATIISRFVYLLVLSIYKIYFLRKSL
jgi:O-antigen/teichoic acid export membrane protein